MNDNQKNIIIDKSLYEIKTYDLIQLSDFNVIWNKTIYKLQYYILPKVFKKEKTKRK